MHVAWNFRTDLMKVKLWILSFGESINMDHWESDISILRSISEYSPERICSYRQKHPHTHTQDESRYFTTELVQIINLINLITTLLIIFYRLHNSTNNYQIQWTFTIWYLLIKRKKEMKYVHKIKLINNRPRNSAASFGKFITTCVMRLAFSLANIAWMNLLPSMLKTWEVTNKVHKKKHTTLFIRKLILWNA